MFSNKPHHAAGLKWEVYWEGGSEVASGRVQRERWRGQGGGVFYPSCDECEKEHDGEYGTCTKGRTQELLYLIAGSLRAGCKDARLP